MDPRPHPHRLDWWKDNPSDPDRPSLTNPDVQRLVGAIEPGAQATDLGGVMSLNVRLDPAGLVLRVHQPSVSRRRLLAVQAVRRGLADRGLVVPVPLSWHGATVFRCGPRWAELERYIAHERAAPAPDSYRWLFGAMGTLHRALAPLATPVPRPLLATYGPPGSLLRWLPVTEAAVRDDPEAAAVVRLLRALVGSLRTQWVPADRLPAHLVHGDVRLSNVGRMPDGQALYLDFGFLARRPRIHDLAYALAFMVRALEGHDAPERFGWHIVPQLVADYEAAALVRLTATERVGSLHGRRAALCRIARWILKRSCQAASQPAAVPAPQRVAAGPSRCATALAYQEPVAPTQPLWHNGARAVCTWGSIHTSR